MTPIIPQTLNINNLRTASAKSINLHAFRKLIKYYLQNVPVKAVFTVTVFKILLYEGRLLLSPAQRGTGNERVKQKKYIYIKKRKKTEKHTLVINTLRVYCVIILGESGCYVFA